MQTYDEKIDSAVHAALTALGLSAVNVPDLADVLNDAIYDACHPYVTDDFADDDA